MINKTLMAFSELIRIMDELREKCPWDKKQTFQTLRHLTIEETYELTDAIIQDSTQDVKKELGDLLLHIVFYAKIASETNDFTLEDVINGINKKLINRHPHVFGDTIAENEEDVKTNWEKIKIKEGNKSVLEGVPNSLPSLVKACRIQEKTRGAGFDWDERYQVLEKVKEEIEELEVELANNDKEKIENEFGDLLFALINYARFIDVNPENALEKTNQKFITRFKYIETKAKEQGKMLSDMNLEEMNILWEEAKKK